MTVDLHNFNRKDAKEYLISKIEEAYKNKDYFIEVIHGFNNGTAIRDYIRNSKQLMDTGYILKIEANPLNSGITNIILNVRKSIL